MRKILPQILSLTLGATSLAATAQSVTYNHDPAKMNQVMVQETGAGILTPEAYYLVSHPVYYKTALTRNKMVYRTAVGTSATLQTEHSNVVDSAMKDRGVIEALNIADMNVDVAWKAEQKKLVTKMNLFKAAIMKITTAGGTPTHAIAWRETYNKYNYAIQVIRSGKMPNSERKKEYLSIYAQICKSYDQLIRFLAYLSSQKETQQLLAVRPLSVSVDKNGIASKAKNNWRAIPAILHALSKPPVNPWKPGGGGSGTGTGTGTGTIVPWKPGITPGINPGVTPGITPGGSLEIITPGLGLELNP